MNILLHGRSAARARFAGCGTGAGGRAFLDALLTEAAQNNPDLQAARREANAARSRISPAGALDDPMLEAGVLNYPVESRSSRPRT